MKRIYYLLLIAISFGTIVLTGCKKDDPEEPKPVINEADEINKFIWTGLHDYYLWVKNVPRLTNNYYASNKDSLNNFLNKYSDHEKLFYDLLYKYEEVDKWSWIVDNYEDLEKEFEGITKSMGYTFRLARYGEQNVLGYVEYVLKGSPAAAAGIKRGDIFTHVNDQQLTISNYMSLLQLSTYKLSFVNIVNNTLVPNGQTANMTAVEITENPIFLDTVYSVNNAKIGYLIYNGFISNYDVQLNNVMQKFKTAGITKLILDLRYNGGGSVNSATYLASMIYGTYTNKLFLKSQYNDMLQAYVKQEFGEDYLNIYFESEITGENNVKTPIVSLNLSDLYVITTDNTASASESVINGLQPYINVVIVGTATHGKYVGSMTIKDYIDNDGNVNPNHKWALQPIVVKIANSQGVSDYINGLAPQVEIEEDIANLSVLGSLQEPLLNKAITKITGVSTVQKAIIPSGIRLMKIPQIQDFTRKTDMYITPKFPIGKLKQ